MTFSATGNVMSVVKASLQTTVALPPASVSTHSSVQAGRGCCLQRMAAPQQAQAAARSGGEMCRAQLVIWTVIQMAPSNDVSWVVWMVDKNEHLK